MDTQLGTNILKEWEASQSKRSTLDSTFRDCAYYFMPAQYDSLANDNSTSDTGRYTVPADPIGLDMVNTLASALFSNTVSTGERWFTLRAAAEDLNEDQEVAEFYCKMTDITLKAIQNSNFSLMVHEDLRLNTCFGTGIIGVEYDKEEDQLVFIVMRITDCAIEENAQGKVNTLFYRTRLTPSQAFGKWGNKCPQEVIKKALDTTQRHVLDTYIRCIKPRPDYNKKSKLNTDMPYMDVVVHETTKQIVTEGGHVEFPFAIHRFDKIGGTPYGRSPAMNALGTVSMIDRVLSDYIDGVEMTIQPPIFIDGDIESVSLSPGSVNSYDATTGGVPSWVNLGVDLRGTEYILQRFEQQLRDIFYVDKFVAMENQKNMTATEVVERVNEKIQSISPVVSRMQSELFEPLIERVVRLLVENGRGPKIPERLAMESDEERGVTGSEFKVIYTTRLDSKLAEVDTSNLLQALQEVSMVMQNLQAIPELDIVLNKDAVVKMIMRNHNVDPDLTRSEKEIKDLRQEQAEAMRLQQQLQAVQSMIKPIDTQKASEEGSPAQNIELAP